MKIVGVDLHAKQQSIAMLDNETGELTERVIRHEGNAVREFYAALEGPVVVGLEATGSMQWFLELLDETQCGAEVSCRTQRCKLPERGEWSRTSYLQAAVP
jgi:hypothetical protein